MDKKPLDPQTRALVAAMSRRRLLQAGAIGGVAAFAAACGVGGTSDSTPTPSEVEDLSDTDKKVVWSSWIDYIDIDEDGNYPSVQKFTAETGITVEYPLDYNDNNEYYAKVKPQLDAGQSIGADLITPTDWMAAFWIKKGYAQALDKTNIPNAANMGATWENIAFDPDRTYSMPWQSGFAGLGWNKKVLKDLTGKTELKTVDELWDPKLRGRITILSEMRDSIGVVLMSLGLRADNFTDADFERAIGVLQEQVDSGQIRQVAGNDYKVAMEADEVAAAIAWSGDMLNNPDRFGFAIPESGGTLWTDNLIIPVGATHKKNAERLINFYYDPVNAAMAAAYINYICPVDGAREAMADIDPSMVDNPAIFPDEATLAKVQVFMSLSDVQQSDFEEQFQALAGA